MSETQEIQFAPFFSVSLWMNINDYGIIFIKQSLSDVEFELSITNSNSLSVFIRTTSSLFNHQATIPGFAINTWFNLVVIFEQNGANTDIIPYYNDAALTGSTLSNDFPVSSVLATITLGNSLMNSWIYEFIYFTYSLTHTQVSSYIGTCTGCTCPLDLNVCLWACPITQYFDGTVCDNCMTGCPSCRYANSCSLCANPSCLACTDPEVLTCSHFCSNRCILCDILVDGCNICAAGYIKSVENVCMLYCSLGDTIGSNCILNSVTAFTFTFTKVSNVYTYGSSSFFMGVTS